jgi:hypothetical protein
MAMWTIVQAKEFFRNGKTLTPAGRGSTLDVRCVQDEEVNMKRILWVLVIVVAAVGLGYDIGVSAASKTYQFTGVVKASDGGTLTVEKSAKEVWTFDTGKDTKGTAKVGDKVTVYYTMMATQIEAKPGTAAAAPKPATAAPAPAGKKK